jgi:hypothetical protein
MTLYKPALVVAVISAIFPIGAHADYKFISSNPFEAQKRLFDDIRMGRISPNNLGPNAIAAITQESMFAATPAKMNYLGEILKICLVVGFKYPSSRALSLRTYHANGCGDWVITTELSPEVVKGIVLVSVKFAPGRTDFCGPPGIIPPVPAGGESFVLADNFQCRDANNLAAPENSEELSKACAIIGGMCSREN